VSTITDAGRRALANTRDADVLRSMVDEPWEGRSARVVTDGTTNALQT
jgi:hypothetical protein